MKFLIVILLLLKYPLALADRFPAYAIDALTEILSFQLDPNNYNELMELYHKHTSKLIRELPAYEKKEDICSDMLLELIIWSHLCEDAAISMGTLAKLVENPLCNPQTPNNYFKLYNETYRQGYKDIFKGVNEDLGENNKKIIDYADIFIRYRLVELLKIPYDPDTKGHLVKFLNNKLIEFCRNYDFIEHKKMLCFYALAVFQIRGFYVRFSEEYNHIRAILSEYIEVTVNEQKDDLLVLLDSINKAEPDSRELPPIVRTQLILVYKAKLPDYGWHFINLND